MWLYNLTGQMEVLANATKTGLQDVNLQLQATSKLTLQNRLALDLLLLHEHGVCGCLDLNNEICCIHMSNVTDNLYKQLDKLKQVAESSRELRGMMEIGWLNKTLHRIGFSLTGWLANLIQTLITVVIIIIVLFCLSCIKRLVLQATTRAYVKMIKQSSETYETEMKGSHSLKGGK